MQYFTTDQPNHAVEWKYPNKKFDPTTVVNVILASSNESVDNWNETIQNMNPNETWMYEAKDSFDEVDDEANILQEIIKAYIKSSPYWSQLHQIKLSENMRVNGLLKSLSSASTVDERKFVEEQMLISRSTWVKIVQENYWMLYTVSKSRL